MPDKTKKPEKPKRLFHQGHYNVLAAVFRRLFEEYDPQTQQGVPYADVALLRLCERLAEDNPDFDLEAWIIQTGWAEYAGLGEEEQ